MSNENTRKRFYDNGIPYDDIDVEMIDLIDVLNFSVGLKTSFCCWGHDAHSETHVVFDRCVTDAAIYKVADFLVKEMRNFGSFDKWLRGWDGDRCVENWTYRFGLRSIDPNSAFKRTFMDHLVGTLRRFQKV